VEDTGIQRNGSQAKITYSKRPHPKVSGVDQNWNFFKSREAFIYNTFFWVFKEG
jgi:hypothetical protein